MVTIHSGGVSAEVVVRKYGASALGFFIGPLPNGEFVIRQMPDEMTGEIAAASPEGDSLWRISITNMGETFDVEAAEDVPSEQFASAAILLGDVPPKYVQAIDDL